MTDVAAPHWIPERLVQAGGQILCEWIDIGDLRFTDPFFEMTVSRRHYDRPERLLSPLERLHNEAAAADALPPVVFIFHVSRCGSTLVSQLFGCDAASVVLSEVPLLDALLRSNLPDREALFVSALRLLGRRRSGAEERLVVKTDSWHIFYADLLRRIYPDTPFVLLYRSPEGVLDSHRRARGMHMVPGLLTRAPFAVEYDSTRQTLDDYAAAVLELFYRAMLDVARVDPRVTLVAYEEGFPAAFERIAGWLGLSCDDRLRARIDERCAYDGKAPQLNFSSPPARLSRDTGSPALRQLFDRLEDLRRRTMRGGDTRRAETS